ncbi:carboxylate--amine ligase/circularly permuted type 2 ATP-grasp protein [Curtobacterium sp. PhB78]|uniref:carboxylate--amine ligase/circularly permuted type 2 ATP-grasp protein n=1 Tax=Curtobacterium sp. PhB78 TaxID=2485102 RepID=UPI000F477B6E|nr:carboxylate--amine ligase/circularly permuted type 2 ATP-grasp protein [Curtobacterium sp. PhB78]ROS37176.1 carboxylate-amine ligase [Curtobacterium sp. PhB78]
MSAELTLGAEEELHLIDLESGRLSAKAPRLLPKLPADRFGAELQRTTIETNTPVVRTLDDLRRVIVDLRRELSAAIAPAGVTIASVGTAPRSEYADFELTSGGRYGRMQEQYRMLVDEQLICGLQVHVGVSDRDLAVQIAQRVAPVLPVLLALSASSPFWNGQDTGYSSFRSIIWQRWPSAGSFGRVSNAAEYDKVLDDLIASGVIADKKMAYFDVRPSSHAPTLELRVCDATPIVDDAVLIAGLFRAAVRKAEVAVESGAEWHPRSEPLHRAAMWQAARTGLSGELLGLGQHPDRLPAEVAVRQLVSRLRPELEELGDWGTVTDLLEATLARGNSTDRQRTAYAERGELDDVVALVVEDTAGTPSGRDEDPAVAVPGYRVRAGDEAVGPGARPRPAFRDLATYFTAWDADTTNEHCAARDAWAREHEVGFVVDGGVQAFGCDLVPRTISAYEWSQLERGLGQRARAIELFLRDVYGERRIVADGVMDEHQFVGANGWDPDASRLPGHAVRAPVLGFDLVRNEFGGWRVLEDNVRSPSGVAYGIALRELMDAVVPDAPRPALLRDPHGVTDRLRETLRANATAVTGNPDPVLALVSDGPAAGAWFEHRRLADGAGLRLLAGSDLDVRDGRVVDATTGDVLDGLYLRIDRDVRALTADHAPELGARILDVAEAGHVHLSNAPGNALVDDKAMYVNVPDLIWYYLDEKPLLESVPTYRTSIEGERLSVLDRVGELVTKPVDGEGGRGVLIGPSASAPEVAERRREIAADPAGWVGQEVVQLSSHPTIGPAGLDPRHVDLRAFVYLTGTGADDAHLADVALTRVAPEGSMVVNSSRGGGAKDTWIVGSAAKAAVEGER